MGAYAVKHVLMIAFHFPPYGMSSGVQRTACFARYLPSCGWEPLVLTASIRSYNAVTKENSNYRGVLVRAFALDTVRHLGVLGKYPGFLALPDRWVSWAIFAILSGIKLIRKYRPRIIWSTYPIATAHLIGYALKRLSGLPWVADFRDPMVDEVHPVPKNKRSIYQWIEKVAVEYATICCFTTPGAMNAYLERYPALSEERCRIVSNGYDEQDFLSISETGKTKKSRKGKLRLLHSGALYPLERDPSCFFEALAILYKEGKIGFHNIEINLRATGHDIPIQKLIEEHGLSEIVTLLPAITYSQAISEMCGMDGLLLLQAGNCNHQIPAKTYEYIRSGIPIFSMTDSQGDTAKLLQSIGADNIAPLDDTQQIKLQFIRYLQLLEEGAEPSTQRNGVSNFSRKNKTVELSSIFDDLG